MKFESEIGCEDLSQVDRLSWLDQWADELQKSVEKGHNSVSKRTLRMPFAKFFESKRLVRYIDGVRIPDIIAIPVSCDLLSNAPHCPIVCDSVTMPKSEPMPKWYRPQIADTIQADTIGNGNPEMELRLEVFCAMIFSEKTQQIFDNEKKCFFTGNMLQSPENFNRVMGFESPLDFVGE